MYGYNTYYVKTVTEAVMATPVQNTAIYLEGPWKANKNMRVSSVMVRAGRLRRKEDEFSTFSLIPILIKE